MRQIILFIAINFVFLALTGMTCNTDECEYATIYNSSNDTIFIRRSYDQMLIMPIPDHLLLPIQPNGTYQLAEWDFKTVDDFYSSHPEVYVMVYSAEQPFGRIHNTYKSVISAVDSILKYNIMPTKCYTLIRMTWNEGKLRCSVALAIINLLYSHTKL